MTKSQNFISGYDIIMTEDKRKQKTSYQISQTSEMIINYSILNRG